MSNQQNVAMTKLIAPARALRPIRRNDPEYVELVGSIRKDGILQPILVRPKDDKYEIVEGWHRMEAAREAGLDEVPCLIKEMTDKEVLIYQIKCNAIRPKTRSFEYARRLKTLMEEGVTIQELSAIIDKSVKWIMDQLALNRLCEAARGPVERGEIKMKAVLALANLPEDLQEKFVDDAIAMSAVEFEVRAKAALRDFKAYLLKELKRNREIGAVTPQLRSVVQLRKEAYESKHAKKVLKETGAKTPLEGWEACMSWLFQLDPVSVERRKRNEKEKAERMNNSEFRKWNRRIINKFVKPQSRTGDYRNVE